MCVISGVKVTKYTKQQIHAKQCSQITTITVHKLLNHEYLAGCACKISDFQMWLYVQTTGRNIY